MPGIITTVQPLANGATPSPGVGEEYTLTFAGTWATGEQYTVVFTDSSSGIQTQVGSGSLVGQSVTGSIPNFLFTFQNKEYVLAGAYVFFSAIGTDNVWNDPNANGNGFVQMSNWYATPEPLLTIAPYQGRLCFFSRRTIQIWTVNANPDQWLQNQILTNIGTVATYSVQAIGDLDVYFLSDSGVRSVRVRDSSNNAYVDDFGSPIDQIIRALLVTLTPTQQQSCQAVVDPVTNTYWLWIPNAAGAATPGTIYVFSKFMASKVAAWGTFQPTYHDPTNAPTYQTYFSPLQFCTLNGLVYCRDASHLIVYGYQGTYDECSATIQTPFMDFKAPANKKLYSGLDAVFFGDLLTNPSSPCQWQVDCNASPSQSGPTSPAWVPVINSSDPVNPIVNPTPDDPVYPYSAEGTHVAFRAFTLGTGSAKFCEIIFHYKDQGEKV